MILGIGESPPDSAALIVQYVQLYNYTLKWFIFKKNGLICFRKKRGQTGGGSEGGSTKDHTFFRIFCFGPLPLHMATSFFYIYVMATIFFYINEMATSFFYICVNGY